MSSIISFSIGIILGIVVGGFVVCIIIGGGRFR